MDKEKNIQQELLKATRSFTTWLLLIASFGIVLLSILDYFATPENFKVFLIYRITVASLYMALLLIFKKVNKFPSFFIIIAALIVSTMIELMVLSFGGHQSPYYAGFIVVFVFLFGLLPISFKMSMILALTIYGTYLLPILVLDKITNPHIFIGNNIFLIATLSGGLIWRYINYKVHIQKLSLEYDLAKDKEQLRIYSTQLEQLVAERTKDLSVSEQKYRELFDNANDGIVVLDKNGIIQKVNNKFCEFHSFEKDILIGTHFSIFEVKDQEDKNQERIKRILNGEALVYEAEHYRKDGNKILLEVSSKAIKIGEELYAQSFYRDITEKKELQKQLLQSQKMESIGALTGGLAHDFKNILTAILGHAELLRESSEWDDSARQKLRIITNSAQKANQIISKLLGFSRKSAFEIRPVNLNDIIKDAIELSKSIVEKKHVKIALEIKGDIPLIDADSNSMEQVIMNILINGIDAMPEGGAIKISTESFNLEKGNAGRIHPLLNAKRCVLMKITDTGIGIPDEIKDKIFDPFFTTKGPDKGTGLGLSMVYGIIKEHNGVIDVKSNMGNGTTFEVYLPASDAEAVMDVSKPIPSAIGNIKILAVGDDKKTLNFIKEALGRYGCKLIIAENPFYAMKVFAEMPDSIDIVITEVFMPLLDGRMLLQQCKSIKQTVKTIAISAYNVNSVAGDNNVDAFIMKPFKSDELISAIKRMEPKGSALQLVN